MDESPQLESAWIIVSCSQSHAENIENLKTNRTHIIVYNDVALEDREATPFGDEERVCFGLRAHSQPIYHFGTSDDAHFQLATAPAGRRLRTSSEQFHVKFNRHGSWMLVDTSTNGTWVEHDLVASNKARGYAASKGIKIEGNYRQIALHPRKWTDIVAGKLHFQIRVGKATPPSFVPDFGELDLENLDLQSHATPISALASSNLIRPAFVGHVTSWKFHHVESDTARSSHATELLVDKSSGRFAVGEVYKKIQIEHAQAHYQALFGILAEGRKKNLVPFLESTSDGPRYMIVSEHWQAESLSELVEKGLTPPPLELSFIFAQINRAVAYLHSQGVMHRNIRPEAILVARGSPVESRLTGFSEAVSAASATEAVGDREYRAPEMNGSQEYDHLVDVFSVSKVFQRCLDIQNISNTPMNPIILKSLARDPLKRPTASLIQEEIDWLADGVYSWPFKSLTLKRRFEIVWYRESSDAYIRLLDLYLLIRALADPYRGPIISPTIKTKHVTDQNFPGQYCRLAYGEKLFNKCGLHFVAKILKPPSSGDGIFSTSVNLDFPLFYHIASQMFNVTTVLKTIPAEVALLATWNLTPQVQEVHGDVQWEGTYIDRHSFEEVLRRVQLSEAIAVFPDLISLSDGRTDTRFAVVDYSRTVIVVTRWLTPPWVLLAREEIGNHDEDRGFVSLSDLQSWCATYKFQSLLDRIDLTIGHRSVLQDWKIVPKLILPPLLDDDMTSLLDQVLSKEDQFVKKKLALGQTGPSPVGVKSFGPTWTHPLVSREPLNKTPGKRRRSKLTPEVYQVLEKAFQDRNATDIEGIAAQTGLEMKQVRVWFQNRRYASRKKHKDNIAFGPFRSGPDLRGISGTVEESNAGPASKMNNLHTPKPRLDQATALIREIQSRDPFSITSIPLTPPQEASRMVEKTSAHNTCEIPQPPHDINEVYSAERVDCHLSLTNHHDGDQVYPDTEPLLYIGEVSQQSHLSLIIPNLGTDGLSPNYTQHLEEHEDLLPF